MYRIKLYKYPRNGNVESETIVIVPFDPRKVPDELKAKKEITYELPKGDYFGRMAACGGIGNILGAGIFGGNWGLGSNIYGSPYMGQDYGKR